MRRSCRHSQQNQHTPLFKSFSTTSAVNLRATAEQVVQGGMLYIDRHTEASFAAPDYRVWSPRRFSRKINSKTKKHKAQKSYEHTFLQHISAADAGNEHTCTYMRRNCRRYNTTSHHITRTHVLFSFFCQLTSWIAVRSDSSILSNSSMAQMPLSARTRAPPSSAISPVTASLLTYWPGGRSVQFVERVASLKMCNTGVPQKTQDEATRSLSRARSRADHTGGTCRGLSAVSTTDRPERPGMFCDCIGSQQSEKRRTTVSAPRVIESK